MRISRVHRQGVVAKADELFAKAPEIANPKILALKSPKLTH